MLVLSRRIEESLIVQPAEGIDPAMTVAELFQNGPVVLHVLATNGNQVRLGVEAPKELNIVRNELLDQDRKLA